jgi:hypothetical protein
MRRLLSCVALWVAVGVSVVGAGDAMRASKPEVKKEIVAVIAAQLAAFRQGDVKQAYGYAARELQAQKPLRTFMAIVQTNYPEIWTNTRAEFGIAWDDGARAAVTVQVFSKEGEAAYDFTLVKEPPGWRVQGILRHEPKKGGRV